MATTGKIAEVFFDKFIESLVVVDLSVLFYWEGDIFKNCKAVK